MRTLKAYAGVTTFNIVVPEDQSSDELLGILPPTTTAADGILAWSIGFSDAFRAPSTSSSSTGATEDALLGPVGAIVGLSAPQGRSGRIRDIRPSILNSNNALAEDSTFIEPLRTTFSFSTSLETLPRLQDEFASELNAIESQQISLGSNPVQTQSQHIIAFIILFSGDVGASNVPTRLFANPLS